MKDLIEIFENLADNHSGLLEAVEDTEAVIGYASTDFFSFEPFYIELHNMKADQCQLYHEPDDVPGEDLHAVVIADKKLIFTSEIFGGGTSYDNFFEYKDNEKYRYQIYKNPERTNVIFAERLISDDEGMPVRFERIDQYVNTTKVYEHLEGCTKVTITHFNRQYQETFNENLMIIFSEDGSQIERIESLDTDSVIYDREEAEKSLGDLVEDTTAALIDIITSGLTDNPLNDVKVEAMLLEYTMQHPFPPTLALIQPHEAVVEEGEHPLLWLNAPDIELFTEGGLENIRFHGPYDALFDSVNARIETLDYEEAAEYVFAIYADLCRKLKDNEQLNKLLDTTEEYFVTARDFEVCNEDEFLDELLPESLLTKFNQAAEAYTTSIEAELANDEDRQATNMILEHKQLDYEDLVERLESKNGKIKYHESDLASIEPFTHHKGKLIDGDIMNMLQSEPPESSAYYEYLVEDGKILRSVYCFDGSRSPVIYIDHQGNRQEAYKFFLKEDGPHLDHYTMLKSKDGVPQVFRSYSPLHFDEIQYRDDDSGRVNEAYEERTIFYSTGSSTANWTRQIDYDASGQLSRITTLDMNGGKTVDYCSDDSYLHENIETTVQMSTEIIMAHIQENAPDLEALALEKNHRLPFPPQVYLARNGAWQRESINAFWDKEYENNCKLGLYLMIDDLERDIYKYTPAKCRELVEHTYQLLAERLTDAIQKQLDKTIPISVKEDHISLPELGE